MNYEIELIKLKLWKELSFHNTLKNETVEKLNEVNVLMLKRRLKQSRS